MGEKKENRLLANNQKLQVLFFCVSMALLFGVYSLITTQLKRRFEIVPDDFSWVYQVDEIKNVNDKLIISGFAFKEEEEAEADAFEIILKNIKTEKRYFSKMDFFKREDVQEYFKCEYDYSKSGFTATLSAKKCAFEEEVYEILIRPKDESIAYSTGIYYAYGKMMFVNPDEFVPLDTKGTDLEIITTKGVLRVYRPDFGMYVYQYEDDFYWIAEPEYGFADGDTYVQFQMKTTQVERLPEDRLAKNWLWGNVSFSFSSKELVDWETGKYRVSKCALPKEYSITKIWTGNYMVDDWVWRNDFRPWYDFSR